MKAQKRVSAITLRILAINMTALVLLAIGLLYVVQYQDRLIAAELDSMKAEAVLFSGAIAEGATQNRLSRIIQPFQSSVNRVIMPNMARRMVRRFSEAKKVHVQVFDSVGGLIADSDDFKNAPGRVHADDLPAPDEENAFSKFVSGMIDGLLNIIPKRITLQDPPDVDGLSAGAYPDAKDGLNGRLSARVWMHPEEKVIYMSAAAPIQRVRQIVGVAYLSKPATNIEAQIREMQVEILKIFIIIFALTIVFSFYLASTMASPISKLARAAYRIRGSKNRDIAIPDLSHRKDEIGELSIALRDMTNSLWQRMDAIERFAADVAHEIKNPLTSLRSAVETARKVKDVKNKETLMDIILHDVHRLDRLITDISRASRLDAELSKEEMQILNIYDLLKHMETMHTLVEQKSDIAVIFNIKELDETTKVMGNEVRLMQVFDNLISNARTFSPEGSEVLIKAMTKNHMVVITVSDHGPGIPEGKAESIFDRFYTERPKGEDYGNHSGLGLSIAKQIISAHSGRIYAENITDEQSDDVKGAVFTVEIPLI
tara:strand:+ start:164 stop:1792 length:1629 start_codon:yes stop_codon:yes gene_type:complete